jgi:deazaflavin-dependent oxidoreductase (nitroreductase family)
VANFYDNMMERFASTRLGAWFFLNIANPLDKRVLRWSRGRLSTGAGTRFNQSFVLLTCKGAQTRLDRIVPLLATFDGDDIILIASNGGYEQNPDWYHNLKKNPEAAVEHQGVQLRCIAHEAEEKERERLWRLAVDNYIGYEKYQQHTSRKIPVMVLKRVNTE